MHVAKIRVFESAKEPEWETILEECDKVAGELPANEKPLVRHQIRLAKANARLEMLDIVGAIECRKPRRFTATMRRSHAPSARCSARRTAKRRIC